MHHASIQEAQSAQGDVDVPPQEAIVYLRDFFEQEDPDASLSNFGELFSFHTKASEFAAILKEDSPALNLTWSSPTIDCKRQEEVSILESFTKCSSTELVGKGVGNSILLLNSVKSSHNRNCIPSKVLDVGVFRRLLSRPSILHERERDEVSNVDKDVPGSDEAQRKRLKDFSVGKRRFDMYADTRYYVDMKIGKAGPPMYIDFHDMLLQCAYAVGLNDTNVAKAVACKVKQQTSPHGSAAERLAHYFVKALYARFAGTGWSLYTGQLNQRPSFTQTLVARMKYISSCPFTQASHLFSNETILRVAKGASKLIIIEHQLIGIQYPSLFKKLAAQPGGPPKVSLIGRTVPHYSMLPFQNDAILGALEETGRRLAKCAALFKVPFQFTPWVGMQWDTTRLQEFVSSKRPPGEVFVAVSTCFLRFVMDDILDPHPIRLEKFKQLCDARPDVLIHGVVSGACSSPFYPARFKEALFHFACIFDVLDTFTGRNNQDRLVFESEVLGRAILNVVACEGLQVSGRVEKYKQWQAILEEAGMQQLSLNAETMHQVEGLLKNWHKDYMIAEDCQYLLLGWRGRSLYALSTWKSPGSSSVFREGVPQFSLEPVENRG